MAVCACIASSTNAPLVIRGGISEGKETPRQLKASSYCFDVIVPFPVTSRVLKYAVRSSLAKRGAFCPRI